MCKDDFLLILSPGHGGTDPSTGKYVTRGKRSPKNSDGEVFYEGVNNRIIVNDFILPEMERRGVNAINVVSDWKDIGLGERVRRANELNREYECLYMDIHSNGHQYQYVDRSCTERYKKGIHSEDIKKYTKLEWTSGHGMGSYIGKNASSRSIEFGEVVQSFLMSHFEGTVKDRHVKARNYYVLRKTVMPASLLELGFHTNLEELERMKTDKWKQTCASAIADAVELYIDRIM